MKWKLLESTEREMNEKMKHCSRKVQETKNENAEKLFEAEERARVAAEGQPSFEKGLFLKRL